MRARHEEQRAEAEKLQHSSALLARSSFAICETFRKRRVESRDIIDYVEFN